MTSRTFTTREKVLTLILTILLITLLYVFAVDRPIRASMENASQRMEELEATIEIEEYFAAELAQMHKELEAIDYGKNSISYTPEYDNVQMLVTYLNSVLVRTDDYDLRFMPITHSGRLASRGIQMTFKCESYRMANSIITQLANSPYSNNVTALKIESTSGDENDITSGGVKVVLTIVYYEIADTPPAKS